MQPYQDRVVDERIALFEKTEKLLAFTNSAIYQKATDHERKLLRKQLKVMVQYLDILNERIEAFEKT